MVLWTAFLVLKATTHDGHSCARYTRLTGGWQGQTRTANKGMSRSCNRHLSRYCLKYLPLCIFSLHFMCLVQFSKYRHGGSLVLIENSCPFHLCTSRHFNNRTASYMQPASLLWLLKGRSWPLSVDCNALKTYIPFKVAAAASVGY